MKKYLIVFFILGIIFRLWFANLIPQPFLFDQIEYHNFAVQILEEGLVVWKARLYGYPLFLALIYKIFGISNFFAVAVVQSIVDCLTAVLVFTIARKIFKNKIIAWISYLLYLFNPYTSVFVVLTLSEVWGIFLIVVISYLFLAPPPRGSTFAHPRGVFMALLLGYLPQVRPAFLFYSVILMGIIVIKFYKSHIHIPGVLAALLLFILPFTYNIIGNWTYFKQFSPTTVDNLFVREFYISLYVPDRSPYHAATTDAFPKEVQKIYNEYTKIPQNADERKVMAQKYLNLGLSKVFANPFDFIASRFSKFWYSWEKHFLFYYTQPENKLVDFLTYWGNNLFIVVSLVSFTFWFGERKKNNLRWFGWLTIFLIAYISLVHSVSLSEERYSLPGYPLLFLFAGYGIFKLLKR